MHRLLSRFEVVEALAVEGLVPTFRASQGDRTPLLHAAAPGFARGALLAG